jgi:hypothetical protein
MMKNLKRGNAETLKSEQAPNRRFKGGVGGNSHHHTPDALKSVLQWLCNGLFPCLGGIPRASFYQFSITAN